MRAMRFVVMNCGGAGGDAAVASSEAGLAGMQGPLVNKGSGHTCRYIWLRTYPEEGSYYVAGPGLLSGPDESEDGVVPERARRSFTHTKCVLPPTLSSLTPHTLVFPQPPPPTFSIDLHCSDAGFFISCASSAMTRSGPSSSMERT